jgi:hypothetical protein
MDWNGLLLGLLMKWFPSVPEPVLYALIGLGLSILTALWKPKLPPVSVADQKAGPPEPRPLVVAVPAAVSVLLAGPLGVLTPAVGDGIRRAGWTIIRWIGGLFTSLK